MNSLKTEIIKKLSAIKYPGFNRDIVSFGIVKDIIIDNQDSVKILLSINTNNDNHKQQIKESILSLINKEYNFYENFTYISAINYFHNIRGPPALS